MKLLSRICLAGGVLLSGSTLCLADRFDPKDDTFEGATKIVVQTTLREEQERTIEIGIDTQDWFTFSAVRGDTYIFCTSTGQIRLSIFSDPATQTVPLATSVCPPVSLVYTPARTQVLYLRVTGDSGQDRAIVPSTYRLTHRKTSSASGGGGGGDSVLVPECKILGPLTTYKANTLVHGTSAPNAESGLPVVKVLVRWKYKTNRWNKWRPAGGTKTWTAIVKTPSKGTTLVQAVSVDSKGNRSPAFTIPVRRQ